MKNKEDNLILAIDIGTQSLRASIVNDKGEILHIVQNKYINPYNSPKVGYAEQDPNYFYNELAKATQKLKEISNGLINSCKAVVMCTFRDSPTFLDEKLEIVRPSILWLDQRTAKVEKRWPTLIGLAFGVVRMTGTAVLNKKKTFAVWVQENEPEVWKKTKYYVPTSAYLNYKLTNQFVDSIGNIVGHFPVDFKHRRPYKDGSLKSYIFDIPSSKLCKLIDVGETIGMISKKSSLETGIPEGIPLFASASDKACETLGDGCVKPSQIALSFGTACTIDVPSKKYIEPEAFLPAYPAAYKNDYNLEVQIYRGFWMIKWFINEFAQEELKEAELKDIAVEDILDEKLAEIEPGSNGLVLQPYWGPGLKRPYARGAILGFSDYHTKHHLYRAIIEGICYALKESYETILKRSKYKKAEYIVVSGGGSKNDIICQMAADIFNISVKKIQTTESSTLGAAMAGFLSLGVFKTAQEAKDAMVHYTKEFIPNKENAKKYNYLYHEVYQSIYPKLNKVNRKLMDFSSNEIL